VEAVLRMVLLSLLNPILCRANVPCGSIIAAKINEHN